jgi:hypothetical protein
MARVEPPSGTLGYAHDLWNLGDVSSIAFTHYYYCYMRADFLVPAFRSEYVLRLGNSLCMGAVSSSFWWFKNMRSKILFSKLRFVGRKD